MARGTTLLLGAILTVTILNLLATLVDRDPTLPPARPHSEPPRGRALEAIQQRLGSIEEMLRAQAAERANGASETPPPASPGKPRDAETAEGSGTVRHEDTNAQDRILAGLHEAGGTTAANEHFKGMTSVEVIAELGAPAEKSEGDGKLHLVYHFTGSRGYGRRIVITLFDGVVTHTTMR